MGHSSVMHPLEEAVTAAFRPGAESLEQARAAREAAPDAPVARARYFGQLARGATPLHADPAHIEEASWWLRERPTDLERVLTGFQHFTHAPFERYSIPRDALECVLDAHGDDASVLRAMGRLVQHHEPKRALTPDLLT